MKQPDPNNPAGRTNFQPRVAVILVNWNGWQDTIACLDSLLGLSYSNFTVFVVDNASADESVLRIREWLSHPAALTSEESRAGVVSGVTARSGKPIIWAETHFNGTRAQEIPGNAEIVLVHSGANRGFAGGNNVGIKSAGIGSHDYFWLLNTDTLVDAASLQELVNRGESDSGIGIVGSTLILYWRPDVVQATGGGSFNFSKMQPHHLGEGKQVSQVEGFSSTVEKKMDYVVGASMLVRRQFLEDVGLMSEDYFLYFEEIDWAVRARGRYTMAYAPRSFVFHKVGGSSARVASFRSAQIQYRNRLKFVARYFPSRYLLAVIRLTFDEFPRHILKRRWVHARAIASSMRWVFKSYRDGAAGRPESYVELPRAERSSL